MSTTTLARREETGMAAHQEARLVFDAQVRQEIRRTVAAEIKTVEQFAAFIGFCETSGLEPRRKEIYGWTDRSGKLVIAIGIEGFRKLASRRVRIIGREIDFLGPDETWREAWISDKPPIACRCQLFVEGIVRPFKKIIYFREFAVQSNPNWQTRWLHMLEIRAEAHTLRLLPDFSAGFSDEQLQLLSKAGEYDPEGGVLPATTIAEQTAAQLPNAPTSATPRPEPAAPTREPAPAAAKPAAEAPADRCGRCNAPHGKPHGARCPERQAAPTSAAPAPAGPDVRSEAITLYRQAGGDPELEEQLIIHICQALQTSGITRLNAVTPGEWERFRDGLREHGCLPGPEGWTLEAEVQTSGGTLPLDDPYQDE